MTPYILRSSAALAAAAALLLTGAERAHAAPVEIKVVTHNVAGGSNSPVEAVDQAVEQARTWGADLVMLQEVCLSQYTRFVKALPAWHEFAAVMRTDKCGGRGDALMDVVASRYVLTPLTTVNGNPWPLTSGADTARDYHLTCAQVAKPGTAGKLIGCTTHLWSGSAPEQVTTREAQTNQIHVLLHPLVTGGSRVVLAGDFNAAPWQSPMDSIYHLANGGGLSSSGDFYEGDQTDMTYWFTNPFGCGPNSCRAGQSTHGDRKIDYVFFSYPGVSDLHGLALPVILSDHNPYRGAATFSF